MTQRLFDDLAVGNIIVEAPMPQPQWMPRGLDHQPEPPRTESALRRQAMIEWKAREPTAEELKDVCPHGNVLKIETCEEGCQ